MNRDADSITEEKSFRALLAPKERALVRTTECAALLLAIAPLACAVSVPPQIAFAVMIACAGVCGAVVPLISGDPQSGIIEEYLRHPKTSLVH
jgi:hypothetical protein